MHTQPWKYWELFWMQFQQLLRETEKKENWTSSWVLTRDLAMLVRCSNHLSYEAGYFTSQFNIWFISNTSLRWLIRLSRKHLNPQMTYSICRFLAQLVRASHRHREVTGWSPAQILNFSGFSSQLLAVSFISYLQFNVWCISYISFSFDHWFWIIVF